MNKTVSLDNGKYEFVIDEFGFLIEVRRNEAHWPAGMEFRYQKATMCMLERIIELESKLFATRASEAAPPIGYLPAHELGRLNSGHDANLRSAKFGQSALDGDVPVFLDAPLTNHERIELYELRGKLEVAAPVAVGDAITDVCASCGNTIGTVADHEQWCSRSDYALLKLREEADSWRRVAEREAELNRKFMNSVNGATYMGEPSLASQAVPDEPRNVDGMTRTEFESDLRVRLQHDNVRAKERGLRQETAAEIEAEVRQRVDRNYPIGTFACPICGKDSPHEHTGAEIAQHRIDQAPDAAKGEPT